MQQQEADLYAKAVEAVDSREKEEAEPKPPGTWPLTPSRISNSVQNKTFLNNQAVVGDRRRQKETIAVS